jgi:MOSC domain-containing protein YiiM
MSRELGPVVRLQVQGARLKPGATGERVYSPEPLVAVDELFVGPDGCLGRAGGPWIVDVHHAAHPDTRFGADRVVSMLTTGAYRALRARFGARLADGVAGENVLVDSDELLVGLPLRGLLLGDVSLTGVRPAEPCVEFSRWCRGVGLEDPGGEDARLALADLLHGARGVYAVPLAAGVVRLGDVVVSAG